MVLSAFREKSWYGSVTLHAAKRMSVAIGGPQTRKAYSLFFLAAAGAGGGPARPAGRAGPPALLM